MNESQLWTSVLLYWTYDNIVYHLSDFHIIDLAILLFPYQVHWQIAKILGSRLQTKGYRRKCEYKGSLWSIGKEVYIQFHKDGQPQLVRCPAYACRQRTTNRIFGNNWGKPERIQVKFCRYIVCRTQISHVRIWAPGPTGRKTAGKSDCFCKGYNEVAFLCINGTERMKLGKNVNWCALLNLNSTILKNR